jgi:hypothetical protein
MKCLFDWMDDETNLGEASFNVKITLQVHKSKSQFLATRLVALYSFGLAYKTYGHVTRVRYLSNLLEGTLKLLHVFRRFQMPAIQCSSHSRVKILQIANTCLANLSLT